VFAPTSRPPQVPFLRRVTRLSTLLFCIGLAGFFISAQEARPSDPLDNWHWRNPVPTGNDLSYIAYGDGTFVAAGYDILTSSDATNWTVRATVVTGQITGLAFGNGRFVAANGNAGVYVSTNTSEWALKKAGEAESSFGCVAFGNGVFVCAGYSNAPGFWRSADGENWIFASVPGQRSLFGITYGSGLFVAVGYGLSITGSEETKILTSTDGVGWVEQNLHVHSLFRSVTWASGRFVAVGAPVATASGMKILIATSANAVDWELQSYPEAFSLYGVSFGNGTYVAVGEPYGAVLRSSDAVNWRAEDPDVLSVLTAITSARGLFVSVGSLGTIRTSVDAIDWTPQDRGIFMDINGINGITCSSNLLVAFGGRYDLFQSTILTSSNGLDWKASSTGGDTVLQHMIYEQQKFVGVGFDGHGEAGILTSTNGRDWTFWLPDDASELYGIAYGNNLFVAVGGDRQINPDLNVTYSYTSSDAENWQEHKLAIPGGMPYDLAYGNGIFVGVGEQDLGIITSRDGVNWDVRHLFGTGPFNGVTYGNGRFVAVSEYGQIYYSFSGMDWLQATNVDLTINDVTYANGIFLAVGSAIWTSSDGIAWVQRSTRSYWLRGATFFNQSFFGAGEFGDILQSDTIPPQQHSVALSLRFGAFPELVLSGASNRAFRIEYKPSLTQGSWQVLSNIYPHTDPFVWQDQRMPLPSSQFYRLLVLP
jgi:hypothetical protein